jgi:hypothetical protein
LIHYDQNGNNLGSLAMLHPSALYFPDGYDGYKYYLYYTPYPPDQDENPCLMRSNDGVNFVAAGVANPLFAFGTQPVFDNYDLADPDVVRVGSSWMIFYQMGEYTGVEYKAHIGVAFSTDGVTFTPYGGAYDPERTSLPVADGNPIIYAQDTNWYENDTVSGDSYPLLMEPTVVFKDGVYNMWYCSYLLPGQAPYLVYANATDPTGPWTKYGPVGPSGFWGHPDVVYDPERELYVMTYLSSNIFESGVPGAICVATSSSPMGPWTNDPSDPVLAAGGGWEGSSLYRSCLVEVGTQWYLYYSANPGSNGQIGLARNIHKRGLIMDSADGCFQR